MYCSLNHIQYLALQLRYELTDVFIIYRYVYIFNFSVKLAKSLHYNIQLLKKTLKIKEKWQDTLNCLSRDLNPRPAKNWVYVVANVESGLELSQLNSSPQV